MSLNDQHKTAPPTLLRFAEFEANLRTEELTRAGRRIRLPRQSFQVLAALTRTPGELVTREQLRAEVWPSGTVIEYEQGLNAAMNRLREALGDSAADPKYIETLPRRGYRFIGSLAAPPATTAPPAVATPEAPPTTRSLSRTWTVVTIGVVAALVAVSVWMLRQRGTAPSRLVPLTALAGEERAPAFSPDGTRIAFAWNGSPGAVGFDLFVKARGSEQLLQLTRVAARSLSAAWSPDGTQIAFARRDEDSSGVYLVSALGGSERRLSSASFPSDFFMQLAWSPDRRRIAYSSYDSSGLDSIKFLDVQSMAVTALPDAPECWTAGLPAFSDDGRQFAFVCATSVGLYGVYLVDGGKPRLIATIMGEAQGLAFERAGSLMLANDAGDGGALWRLDLDGTRARLPFGEEGTQPTRLRDGEQFAYVRMRQSVAIWRMDLQAADIGASTQRLIASTRSESTPAFSADGARIAFQSNRSGSAEIWMADASGANPVRLTAFDGPLAGAPRWCADGRRVAFDSRAAGSSAVYVLDVDQRRPQRIGNTQVPLGLPIWSPDCQWLLASDGRSHLYRVSVPDGKAEAFTTQPSYYAQFAGSDVIFNVKSPDGVKLWRARDGQEAELPGLPKISYLDAWTATARGVYFTSSEHGAASVQFYDLATREVHRVTTLPKPPVPGGGLGIAVSPDDRWLLFTQNGETQSDLMLVE